VHENFKTVPVLAKRGHDRIDFLIAADIERKGEI
jgi:hypothetical protein